MTKAAHHRGTYHRRSRQLTAAARADPTTRCWKPDCNKLITEVRHKNGRPGWWTAGHERPGDPTSPLHPECSVCAATEGGTITTAKLRTRNGTATYLRNDRW